MTEQQYNRICGMILAGVSLSENDAHSFMEVLRTFEGLLDETDCDDYFGTQGWRYQLGWES